MSTGYGRLKAYYHRSKIIENMGGTTPHLVYDCKQYMKEMELRYIVTRSEDRWPLNKNQLVTKYFSKFRKFISSMDFKSNQPVGIS